MCYTARVGGLMCYTARVGRAIVLFSEVVIGRSYSIVLLNSYKSYRMLLLALFVRAWRHY